MPREPIVRVAAVLRFLRILKRYDPRAIAGSCSPQAEITHRIDVRRFAAQKRAALATHRSQVHGTSRAALLFRLLLRLPTPVFGLLLGREWFVEAASVRRGPTRLPG